MSLLLLRHRLPVSCHHDHQMEAIEALALAGFDNFHHHAQASNELDLINTDNSPQTQSGTLSWALLHWALHILGTPHITAHVFLDLIWQTSPNANNKPKLCLHGTLGPGNGLGLGGSGSSGIPTHSTYRVHTFLYHAIVWFQ